MPTVTLSDLQSRGFALVSGQGERLQMWTGSAQASGESVMLWWDSVANRAFRVPEGINSRRAMMAAAAVAVVCEEIIAALPIVVMTPQKKAEMLQLLRFGVSEVFIP